MIRFPPTPVQLWLHPRLIGWLENCIPHYAGSELYDEGQGSGRRRTLLVHMDRVVPETRRSIVSLLNALDPYDPTHERMEVRVVTRKPEGLTLEVWVKRARLAGGWSRGRL